MFSWHVFFSVTILMIYTTFKTLAANFNNVIVPKSKKRQARRTGDWQLEKVGGDILQSFPQTDHQIYYNIFHWRGLLSFLRINFIYCNLPRGELITS